MITIFYAKLVHFTVFEDEAPLNLFILKSRY